MKHCYFFFTFCLAFFAGISQIPTGSLVGYWPFSGNANDMSGNSNNGTVTGATLTSDRFGNCNEAYYLNGSGNKIVVPNAASIDMNNTDNFSVCYWMNSATGATVLGTMICKNQYGTNTGYQFFTSAGGYCNAFPGQLSFYTAPSQAACSNTNIVAAVNNGTWYFITGVYNATANVASLYVNGVLQSQTGNRTGNLSTSVGLYFGCQTNSTEFYKGTLDDIRIYKRLLSQAEIIALYNEPNPNTVATPTNMTPPANLTLCAGASTTLSAVNGSNTISWYSSPVSTLVLGTGTNFITPTLTAGNYTYYAESAAYCTVSPRAPVSLTVYPVVNLLNTTSLPNQSVCAGNSASLSVSSGTAAVSWYATMNSTVVLATGNSFISPTLAVGSYSYFAETTSCGSPTRIPVTFTVFPISQAQNATPSQNQQVCSGGSATLTAVTPSGSINWYSTPTSTSVLVNGNIFVSPVLPLGSYTYYAASSDCGARTAITFTVVECAGIQSHVQAMLEARTYPNPNNGFLTVEANESGRLAIRNIYGQIIYIDKISVGKNSLNLTAMPGGVYFLELSLQSGICVSKIIKE